MFRLKNSSRFFGVFSSGIFISGLFNFNADFGFGYDCGPHDQPGITCSPGAPNKPAPTPQEEPAPTYENSEPVYETPAPAYTSPAVTASPTPAAPKPKSKSPKKKPKSPKSSRFVSPLSEVDTPVGVDSFSPDAKPVFSFDPVGRDNVGRPIRNYVTPPLVTGAETDAEFVFVRDHLLVGLPVVGGLVGAGLGLPLGLLGPVGSSLFPGLSLGSLGSLIGGNIGLYTGASASLAVNSLFYGLSLASTGFGVLAGGLATSFAAGYAGMIGGLLGSLIGGVYGSMAATPSLFVPASSFGSVSSFGGGLSSAASGASLGAGLTGSLPSLGAGVGAWAGDITSFVIAPIAGSMIYLEYFGVSTSLGSASGYVAPVSSGLSISPSLATVGATAGLVTGITTGIAGFLSGTQIHVDDNPPTPAPKQSKRK